MSTPANSLNITATGLVKFDGTATFTATTTTQYNVLIGNTSNAIANIAPSATSGVALISQGNAANPAFGTVVVAGGGTGAVTLTGILTGNGTSAITASTVTQFGVLVGGATNAVGSTAVGSTGQVLQGNTGANPTYSTATFPSIATGTGTLLRADGTNWVATTSTYPNTNAVSTLLYASSTNVMSALATANNGLLVTSNTGVPSILAGPGTTGQIIQSNAAAAPSFSTASYPSTTTVSQILYSSSTNVIAGLATANNGLLTTGNTGVPAILAGPGTTGNILQSNAAAAPSFSTATYPSIATGTGTILRADGTNWVATTATYPATTTSQQILYSTATNVVGQLTTANSALAATNSSGTLAMRLFSVVRQVFTSTGTYTPTAGMLYCDIECVGGGGGGGGTGTGGSLTFSAGGGGGGGAYSKITVSTATIGVSQAVTIPNAAAGGTAGNNAGASPAATTLGTICTANGGSGGAGNTGSGSSAGGAGGTVGTGDFSVAGQAGGSTIGSPASVVQSFGQGGSSTLGFGGTGKVTVTAATGNAGQLYGGGGSGGGSFNAGGTAAGGAGGKGIVIVTEYIIA